MKVRDVMTRPARTISPETSVRDILRTMVDAGVSGLPVVDSGCRLLGFVPESALMARVVKPKSEGTLNVLEFVDQQKRLYGSTAAEIMTRDPLFIEDSADLTEAIELMLREKVSRLPVTRRGQVVGYLSRTDILKAVLEIEERKAHRATKPTDDEIRARALDALHAYLGATALSVNLSVRNGTVELTGTVEAPESGREIAQILASLPGVKAVVNQLLMDRLLD